MERREIANNRGIYDKRGIGERWTEEREEGVLTMMGEKFSNTRDARWWNREGASLAEGRRRGEEIKG